MRRGRSWRSGSSSSRGHFGGGRPGFSPRGFSPAGSRPRLNRPPWPRPLLPPLHRPFNPNLPRSAESFEIGQSEDDYHQHSYQNNSQRGFQHGSRKGFQQGPSQNYQHDNRKDYYHEEPPGPFDSARPPMEYRKGQQKFQGPVWNKGKAPSIFNKVAIEHNSLNFDQNHPDQVDSDPPDFNEKRPDFPNIRSDFNKSRAILNQSRECERSKYDPSHCKQGPPEIPNRGTSLRNTDFHEDQCDTDFQSSSLNCNNFQQMPHNYNAGRHQFDTIRQSNYHHDEVDFSRPPPFFEHRSQSQDLTSDTFHYDDQLEPPKVEAHPNTKMNRGKPLSRALLSTPEYSGQRPPAIDHYTESSAIDDGFKSIGDTVDIIKKRLLDRQGKPLSQHDDHPDKVNWIENKSPSKREKCHKRNASRESGQHISRSEKKCARIKKKIVREMFKMDKNTLHKLVDDPQSSAKFEYALNSLITESRNSLNRQMRSAAEKSLCGSGGISAVPDKDDTVYEDTFMAQMQGILDPSDIIVLSDIKPMVMAEINKVLEVDEYGHHASYSEDDERRIISKQHFESDATTQNFEADPFEVDPISDAPIQPDENSVEEGLYVSDQEEPAPQPVFPQHNRNRIDSHNSKSRENILSEEETGPKFPDNLDSISDDEYTFAELDKQYHVAVVNMNDPIERSRSPQEFTDSSEQMGLGNCIKNCGDKTPSDNVFVPSNEIPVNSKQDMKRTSMHDSILKIADQKLAEIMPSISVKVESQTDIKNNTSNNTEMIGKDIQNDPGKNTEMIGKEKKVVVKTELKDHHVERNKNSKNIVLKNDLATNHKKDNSVSKTFSPEKRQSKVHGSQTESSTKIVSKSYESRKREADEKISHRKEKRKKCEVIKPDQKKSEGNKKVLNKNIIINVNDCASKNSENCETGAKSVFNLFFSKPNGDELHDDTKCTDSVNISYSDKYVKRKISPERSDKEHKKTDRKKAVSTSPINSHTPSKESTQCLKSENKVKLQPINMFEHSVRKPPAHIARRNTSIISPESDIQTSKPVESKDISLKSSRPIIIQKSNITKVVKREKMLTSSVTQTSLKVHSRFTQTKEEFVKKMFSKCCQTDVQAEDKIKSRTNCKPEDVMERMKEIDLEIQQLLQEKFKLYNNMESVEPMDNSMQSLGMAVVNMTPNLVVENSDESGMLDTFANMSEEELQEIALQEIPDASTNLDTADVEEELSKKMVKKRTKKVSEHMPGEDAIKKTKKTPKIVLKLNKNSPDGNDSFDQYKVVKSPKKQKKVSFSDTNTNIPKESRQRWTHKATLSLIDKIVHDEEHQDDVPKLHENDDLYSSKKVKKVTKSPKKSKAKSLSKKEIERLKMTVRECFIVVTREIFSISLLSQLAATDFDCVNEEVIEMPETTETHEQRHPDSAVLINRELSHEVEIVETNPEIIDISDVQDDNEVVGFSGIQLHDDMLDVSEDIVIDGNFDIDKPVDIFVERMPVQECDVVPISQKDTLHSDVAKDSCKLYDFSANSELCADMIKISGHGDAVVAMECVNDNFLAASIDGNVYYYNGRDGRLLTTLRGSNFPLTCLSVAEDNHGTTVYTGSLDSRIRYYDLETGMEKGPECNVLSPIQSMDRAWGTIFIGTRTGFVLQFECKNNMIIPVSSVKFSDQTILALRALKEGPRKVLLVASRSDQVTIKDAQSGLLLRTLEGPKMTVYCLLFEDGKVFCGTSTNQIQVFDFTSGASVGTHNGGKGVVCLRAAGGLLLAGCYDGCVYVYKPRGCEPVAQLRGPSNMLLSLAVVRSSIVASYKDRSVYMWKIPVNILSEMVL